MVVVIGVRAVLDGNLFTDNSLDVIGDCFHLAEAARRAISLRSSLVSFSARAYPPLAPISDGLISFSSATVNIPYSDRY